MEKTTRAVAVLAAGILLLAPLVNGVLEEAAATADRIFLKEADWNGDPPEDPPEGEPPDDLNRTDLDGNLTGPGGGQPNCSIVERWGPRWVHAPVEANPFAGASNRTTDPTQRTFEITESDIAFGVLLNVTNLRGSLSAYVYPEGERENNEFMFEQTQPNPDNVHETSTTKGAKLAPGTWVAELNYQPAHYDSLQFVLRIASCAEASR